MDQKDCLKKAVLFYKALKPSKTSSCNLPTENKNPLLNNVALKGDIYDIIWTNVFDE